MLLHEVLILVIASTGTILIPVGFDIVSTTRKYLHGIITIIFGTLCAFVALVGWINLFFY